MNRKSNRTGSWTWANGRPTPFLMASASCSSRGRTPGLDDARLSSVIAALPLGPDRSLGEHSPTTTMYFLHWAEGGRPEQRGDGIGAFQELTPQNERKSVCVCVCRRSRWWGQGSDPVPSPPSTNTQPGPGLCPTLALRYSVRESFQKGEPLAILLIEVILLRDRKSNRTGGWIGAEVASPGGAWQAPRGSRRGRRGRTG